MIRNIVFDMGRVLLAFDPPDIASHFTDTPQDAQLLAQNLFESACWESLDRGTITHEDARNIVRLTLPERLHPNLDRAMKEWYRYIPPIDGMESLIHRLKEAGYHLYVLTNASIQFYHYQDTLPAAGCFDGILVSADYKMLKPEPSIYHALAERFDLVLSQSLFIDDRPINIAGAKNVGMEAVLFEDAESLAQSLNRLGILP